MRDTHHLLLLSIIGVSGCPEEATVHDEDDGNGRLALSEVCEEYVEHSYTCNGEQLEDPAETYCEESQKYFDGYSDDCQGALAEHWACLSTVDCETLNSDGSYETCRETKRAGYHACPLLFAYCEASVGSGSTSPCYESREGCIDGKIYRLECADQADGSMACECQIDGEAIEAFDVPNASCLGFIGYEHLDRCGFPDGV